MTNVKSWKAKAISNFHCINFGFGYYSSELYILYTTTIVQEVG